MLIDNINIMKAHNGAACTIGVRLKLTHQSNHFWFSFKFFYYFD